MKENIEKQSKNKDNKKDKLIIVLIVILVIALTVILLMGFMIFNLFKLYKEECNPGFYIEQGHPELDKPIIYLYPENPTNITVKLGKEENLIHTYPKYENSWNVLANPNGDLKDLKTGRNIYSLYWEGKNVVDPNFDEGFVVEGKDTISFLEEKLKILGLNEREANEFIIYWLPRMENNRYNLIRFQEMEEIDENMPLYISPIPDTVIRVMMEFKKLDEYVEVKQQKLETPKRNGYVALEWGGTEIK